MIIKVCGMRDANNIRDIENIGIDWMGFVCYNQSPRFVNTIPAYMPTRVKRVGVFVNAKIDFILTWTKNLNLDYIQLHGTESPMFCSTLHNRGLHLIKAFTPRKPSDFKQIASYTPYCDFLLFDTPCLTFGGSGKIFDWNLLQYYTNNIPFLLSGGICPDSLKLLQQFRHPQWAGIDLNSGFETKPAIKDATMLQLFIKQIKNSLF